MPSWTLNDLLSHATARIGRRSDLAASTVSFYVNQAYQEIAQAEPGALLETIVVSSTTSGENRLSLPANMMELINLSWLTTNAVASGQTLRRAGLERCDSAGFLPLAKPQEYVLFSNWVELCVMVPTYRTSAPTSRQAVKSFWNSGSWLPS